MNLGILTKPAYKVFAVGRQYSPEILTTIGVVGVVGGAVMGARATLKLESVIDHINFRKQTALANIIVQYGSDDPDILKGDPQYQKAVKKAYVDGAWGIFKLYGPAVGVGVAGLVCIVSAHGILRKRNVALAAAYTTIERAYNAYRGRVVEEYGEEVDRDFAYGIRTEEVTDPETGKKSKVTTIDTESGASPYSRVFDKTNWNWNNGDTMEHRLYFLKAIQEEMNHELQQRGYLFLNEVYQKLGYDPTEAGGIVGWHLGDNSDNYVDFGIYDLTQQAKRQFLAQDGPFVILDFNVDGPIGRFIPKF